LWRANLCYDLLGDEESLWRGEFLIEALAAAKNFVRLKEEEEEDLVVARTGEENFGERERER
jgi:hypothetical protein